MYAGLFFWKSFSFFMLCIVDRVVLRRGFWCERIGCGDLIWRLGHRSCSLLLAGRFTFMGEIIFVLVFRSSLIFIFEVRFLFVSCRLECRLLFCLYFVGNCLMICGFVLGSSCLMMKIRSCRLRMSLLIHLWLLLGCFFIFLAEVQNEDL